MVLDFNKTLTEALENINVKKYHHIAIHESETVRTVQMSDDIIDHYGKAKWKIIYILNNYYNHRLNHRLNQKFDLYNWLHKKEDDVAYFLSEAGSNCLNYSTFKAPAQFHLWCGNNSFVIAIEQKGEGFPAKIIDIKKLRKNDGAGFDFFRQCKSSIFFNNPTAATIVFMECSLKNVQS